MGGLGEEREKRVIPDGPKAEVLGGYFWAWELGDGDGEEVFKLLFASWHDG